MNNELTFKSVFLAEVLSSLNKRSKAIKYKTNAYNIQKVIEKNNGQESEKVEIDITSNVSNTSIRIFFWEDRWIWIDLRIPSKQGWQFEWQNEGRVGSNEGQHIVKALERTIEEATSLPSEGAKQILSDIWKNIVLRGPQNDIKSRFK